MWSYRNQLIVALRGYSEARGYRNWLQVGRRVRKSQRAFYVVAPWLKKKEDKTAKADEKEEEKVLVGFRAVPVFGLEQTEPDRDWKLEKKYNPLFGETDETVWIVDGYRQPWYQWYSAIRPDAEDQLTAHLGAAVVAKVFSEATELQDLLNQLSSHSAEEIAERIDEACKAAAAYLEAHARAEA